MIRSTLVQVMTWCRQATSHYLSQCWPRSLLPYGVTRPQWVNTDLHKVSWLFTLCSKNQFQMGFHPTLRKQIPQFDPLKMAPKSGICPQRSPCHLIVFCALSHICVIEHCVIGWEHDWVWPNWLNWWAWLWVSAFKIHFPNTVKPWNLRARVGQPSQCTTKTFLGLPDYDFGLWFCWY